MLKKTRTRREWRWRWIYTVMRHFDVTRETEGSNTDSQSLLGSPDTGQRTHTRTHTHARREAHTHTHEHIDKHIYCTHKPVAKG